MPTREEIMKERGHYTCPGWCLQPTDEADVEEHRGEWATYTNQDGATVHVRPVAGWLETGVGSGKVDLIVTGDVFPDAAGRGQPGLRLTSSDRHQFDKLLDDASGQVDDWVVYSPPQTWQWAYPGAEDDEAEEEE